MHYILGGFVIGLLATQLTWNRADVLPIEVLEIVLELVVLACLTYLVYAGLFRPILQHKQDVDEEHKLEKP